MTTLEPRGNAEIQEVLARGGEMGALMRAVDWSATKIGPIERWPTSLKTMVGVLLASRFPMLLWWGPDLVQLYNDGYRPILGDKHPQSLGSTALQVWSEIWHIIGPQAESVLRGEGATWNENLFLPMNRRGYVEETYFTFSYSAVPDDGGGVGGVLVTVQETTVQVQAERQLKTLRDLGAHAADAKSAREACTTAAPILAANDADLPFALLYLFDDKSSEAVLAASAGLDHHNGSGKPTRISLATDAPTWPLTGTWEHNAFMVVDDITARFGEMPRGRWSTPPKQAVILRLAAPGVRPYGVLIAGVNPLRALDDRYKELFRLVAEQVSTAISSALAFEEQRRRADALVELDSAKTVFFSNVSHEFRTPLTLILNPVEDALADATSPLAQPQRERLELVRRNGLRLQKLVNTLLDFSRIEAGRTQAAFVATDLAALTAELASGFRSAIEMAGLQLIVECEPLPELVYVDPLMWEKVVLNLLSNAFKFTLKGEIRVTLAWLDDKVQLRVSDTGTGIAPENLPRIFDRFHRVEGTPSRSHEGSGIGLSLVRELIKLHAGNIEVQSTLGAGTTFIATILRGSAHLPQDRIASASSNAEPTTTSATYLSEIAQWKGEPVTPMLPAAVHSAHTPVARILIADDNADMRNYIARLLATRWQVEAVGDGLAALAAARSNPPDLVLSDVMMPKMDGMALIQALREDPKTQTLPIILLSARAGEEATIHGLQSGADEYLVKPFSATELLARVNAQLTVSRLRHESTRAARQHAHEANHLLAEAQKALRARDEMMALVSNDLRTPLTAIDYAAQLLDRDLLRDRTHDAGSKLHKQVGTILRATDLMNRLITDLLDVANIEAGTFAVHLGPCNVDCVVRDTLNAFLPAANEKGIVFSADCEAQLPELPADKDRLLQALSNLVSNAIKFTPSGGTVHIRAARAGDTTEFSVSDTGSGIPADALVYVFDRYWRTNQRQREGYGLGLAIAKGIVNAHGGTLHVSSEVNRGSTFSFTVPFQPSTKQVKQDTSSSQSVAVPYQSSEYAAFPTGGGEVGAMMRRIDWRHTVFGPTVRWPQSLRTAIDIMLESEFPMMLAWGPEFRHLYNDACRAVLGTKHPDALGKTGPEIFPEAWHLVEPLFKKTRLGSAVALNDVYIPLHKSGYLEDCYFTFSLSPVRIESGVIGATLAVIADTTPTVEAQRRLSTLRELMRAFDAESVEEASRHAASILANNRVDVPFSLIYLRDAPDAMQLVAATGIEPGCAAAPSVMKCDASGCRRAWPVSRVMDTGKAEVVNDVVSLFGPLAGGVYPESSHTALVLPLACQGAKEIPGVLIVGVNPRRALDDAYRSFFDVVTEHIGGAIASTRAREAERRRAQVLTDVDRAKTVFFSNVSHEFRTPLTLILGPVEDALADPAGMLCGENLKVVHRNALRLYKMVGTLLDFARTQAGRAQARFVPTDLAALTKDLASTFRAVAENAGLRFEVECAALPEAIYIDPEMWEKIVLNLLSNAVKYTYQGSIRVALEWAGKEVILRVQDTGVGIPEEEVPRIFERFYRARVTQGRSHEGTGIGLALVKELTELHGGRVEVESQQGVGTTFTIHLLRGFEHLPKEGVERTARLRSLNSGADAFVEEASRWVVRSSDTQASQSTQTLNNMPHGAVSSRVLFADDNADLRGYVSGLLARFFDVKVASDGRTALEVARTGWPDIIVSDVIMPEMDGFSLVQALRADESTRSIPIILLSARAGEESTVEGLNQGADDYLAKPFSARELVARVRTHLEVARARSDVWRQRAHVDELARSLAARDEFVSIASHELRTPLTALEVQLESVLNLLMKENVETANGRLSGKLEVALRQVDRLTRLIESLLDVSRIAMGRLELEYEEFDLAELVYQVASQSDDDARAAGSRIIVRANSVQGTWDRSRIEQVLLSLISNAIKYSPGTSIDVKVHRSANEAIVVVCDYGMGVRAEDLSRIFERFERAVSAEHYGGLGVGLYLARQTIAAHGGTLEVESSPGQGATFTVRLPLIANDEHVTARGESNNVEVW